MNSSDTIAAIATAPGTGGVGIIRVSGPAAHDILSAIFTARSGEATGGRYQPRCMHFGSVADRQGRLLDEALAVFFPAPHSFTGEDVAEIHAHGGFALLQVILEQILQHGARLAEAGEFTRRAFLNGRMDLTQAEAVAELIAAPGPEAVRLASAKLGGLLGQRISQSRERLEYLRQRMSLALDFPDEEGEQLPPEEFAAITREVAEGLRLLLSGYQRARDWRDGAMVTLIGRVNSGKSSLLNALLGRPRAIVTDRPGTTRDYLEEYINLDGLPVRLVDTAGLRNDSTDPIEKEGMRLGRELADKAQVVLVLLDGDLWPEAIDPDDEFSILNTLFRMELDLVRELGPERCLVLWNKRDLAPLPLRTTLFFPAPVLAISAAQGLGLEELCAAIRKLCGVLPLTTDDLAPNLRQSSLLEAAMQELEELEREIDEGLPLDLCGVRLETAANYLADITGLNSAEETLNAIFANFCIGK